MEFFSEMAVIRRALMALTAVTLLLQLQAYGPDGQSPALTPPQGNSLKLKLKALRGKYVYKCQNNDWIPVSATADLVNILDRSTSRGKYLLAYRPSNPKFAGIWYLNNGDADSAESGAATSIVAGQEIAEEPSAYGGVPQILAEASYHENYGIGSQVSYIQRPFTKGGLPPAQKHLNCSEKHPTAVVPFEAEFWFYTQDLLPPAVPASMAVPSGRIVQGFFCKGVTVYTYDGSAWRRTNVRGKLYDVPGGNFVGNYYLRANSDSHGGNFCLQTENPNAWLVNAKVEGQPVQVTNGSIPWSLYKITSSSGNTTLLGPFNYFQMIGTRGGLPPKPSDATATPRKGAVWNSIFTNQFWLYALS